MPTPSFRTQRLSAISESLQGSGGSCCTHVSCDPKRRPRRGEPDHGANGCRFSLNGILLPLPDVSWAGRPNGLLLGMGHLHRGAVDRLSGKSLGIRLAFFGHHYTHFFFALNPTPPFETIAVGSEFCFGTLRDVRANQTRDGAGDGTAHLDCEAVQYATGMVRDGAQLVVSYGVNDCTQRLFHTDLNDVLSDLQAVAGGASPP